MSIRPRDYAPDISLKREMDYQDRLEYVDIWGRVTNHPYGDNARTAKPEFNPIDMLIPAQYGEIYRGDDWSIWNPTKNWELTEVDPGTGIDPTLVQIGNSPFWRSSDEPVDPTDCQRWPNSPYCGGGFNPKSQLLNGVFIPTSTSCETCLSWQPSFLGIPGPVTRVCYRKDSDFCRVPLPESKPWTDSSIDRTAYIPVPKAPEGKIRMLFCFTETLVRNYVAGEYFRELSSYTHTIEPGVIRVPVEAFMFRDGSTIPAWEQAISPDPSANHVNRYPLVSLYDKFSRTHTGSQFPGFFNSQFITHLTGEDGKSSGINNVQPNGDIGAVSLRVDDISYVWFIDIDCHNIGNSPLKLQSIASLYEKELSEIFRPASLEDSDIYSYFYNGADLPYQWSLRSTPNNHFKYVSVAGSPTCPLPTIDPTPVKEPDPMDCCEEVLEQIELLHLKNNKVYNILGGDRWFKGDSETPDLDIDAETAINTVRSDLYRDDTQADSETVSAPDLISLLATYQAVLYQRSGFHRFPAVVPENLALDPDGNDDPDLSIVDAMSWQEWLVKQIDALMGAWPIKVKYKDEEGEESTIELHNNSEAIAELYGLLLSVAGDVDIQTELAFKTITEAIATKVAATTASDYAKANAEFLGYKGNLKEKKIPMAITPGADTLKKALETSEQKVPRWINEDKLDLVQLLTQILFATEVVKSAFWETFDPDRGVRGDGIKERREQGNPGDEDSWQAFINELRNPTGVRYSDLFPRPDINNLPQEERDGN